MSNLHYTPDDLIDLILQRNASPQALQPHLRECTQCRQEYDRIALTLDLCSRHEAPSLPPAEKVDLFEHAWQKAQKDRLHVNNTYRNHRNTPPYLALWKYISRPAFTFAFGLAVGVFLTLAYAQGSLDVAQEAVAQPALTVHGNGLVKTISGQAIDDMYPFVENPIVVTQPAKPYTQEKQRVLYGTVENGSIQVVWNF